MKFDFAALDTEFEADWPVRVQVPQDGGTVQEQEFSIRFRLRDEQTLEAFGSDTAAAKAALTSVVVGFGKGEKQAFSPELLAKMVTRPYVRVALNKAYGEFALGAPTKNSETPPD